MTEAMSKARQLHAARGSLPKFPSPEERQLYVEANRARSSLVEDNWVDKVRAFRDLYQLSQHNQADIGPLSEARSRLHRRMFLEEVLETLGVSAGADEIRSIVSGTPRPSFDEEVDGVLDTIYIAIGWLLEMGFQPVHLLLLMEEVHASNMTKTDDGGRPIFDEDGKVLKGDNYVKADIAGLITQMRVGLLNDETPATEESASA